MNNFYYTYVLRSRKDDKLYIGWTDNLERRIKKHNGGLVRATFRRRPLRLIYFEACLEKRAAVKREKALKTGFGRQYLKRRLNINPR